MLTGENDAELSRDRFWVVEPGAMPTLSTGKARYAVGEAIDVEWANAPARRFDWVGIYAAGETDLYGGYWVYAYTGATVAGGVTFDSALLGDEMLPEGEYVARLMLDDGYAVLAESRFTVGGNQMR